MEFTAGIDRSSWGFWTEHLAKEERAFGADLTMLAEAAIVECLFRAWRKLRDSRLQQTGVTA